MDNATGPKSAIESLRTVEFRLGLRGYDVDEVDDYLEKVAVEADAMQEQLRQATDRLRQAADRIAQLEANRPEPAESEAEAARVVADANAEAARLKAEADRRYKEDLSKLEGLKSKLSGDVESMARQLEAERTRLRTSLSEMIQWIEDNVQPGAAILALRQAPTSAPASQGAESEVAPITRVTED